MTILILGGQDDDHAVHMLEQLRRRRVNAELVDSRWFPTQMTLAFDPTCERGLLRLPGGRKIPFTDVHAVYWRCYNGIQPPPLPDPEQAFIASNDARGLFESFLIRLKARWVNGWNAFQMHQTKPVQLARVALLGVPVPATILANDAEAVRDFAGRHPRSIFKPVQGGAHTRRVTPGHLTDENLKNLAYAPVTLQEEVPGTNVRVFIAGPRVLACTLNTEAIDFRDDLEADVRPHALPPAIAEQSLRIARELELLWTGMDFRLTPEGRYVFLEANPSPMFLGFEARTKQPLTDSLAALLMEKPS